MDTEVFRIIGLVIAMAAGVSLSAFTCHEWDRIRPPTARTLLVIFNASLFLLVYSFGEAAEQQAPLGARVFLLSIVAVATLVVLAAYRFTRSH
jgi:hypothetical protein